MYAWFVRDESNGKFFNRLVKERYRYVRLDDGQASSGESDLQQLLRDSLESEKSKEEKRSGRPPRAQERRLTGRQLSTPKRTMVVSDGERSIPEKRTFVCRV